MFSKIIRTLLIYDDRCFQCYKFAILMHKLSKGWIQIEGHYSSEELKSLKRIIFPIDYDPTIMFWIVNTKGAWGARSAIIPLLMEIIKGIFKFDHYTDDKYFNYSPCSYDQNSSSCFDTITTMKRIMSVFKKSGKFPFS